MVTRWHRLLFPSGFEPHQIPVLDMEFRRVFDDDEAIRLLEAPGRRPAHRPREQVPGASTMSPRSRSIPG